MMTEDVKATGRSHPPPRVTTEAFFGTGTRQDIFQGSRILHYYWQWWCSDDDDVPVDEGNVDDYDQSLPSYPTWWSCTASLWFRSRTDQAAVWDITIQRPASAQGTKHEQNIYHFNHHNSFNHGWILHQLLCPYEYSYRWKTDRMSEMMYLCYRGLWQQG